MEIKRYKINYENWKCIIKKKFIQHRIEDSNLKGYIGMLFIEEVSAVQKWKVAGEELDVCDKGYVWLIIIPDNMNCCITAMMDTDNKVILWYIDIIENVQEGKDKILEYDDLFLDYIVMPNGCIHEEDREELMKAYSEKSISHNQFILIKSVVASLKKEGYLGNEKLLRLTKHVYYKMVEKYGDKTTN